MTDLFPTKEDFVILIGRNKGKLFIKNLITLLLNKKSNIQEFYDFYGSLIKDYRNFALNRCYHLFREKASKILTIDSLVKMDKYLLDNYAFSGGEELIISFKGEFKRPRAKLIGHIFLTNYRFLGTGILKEKGSSPGTGPSTLVGLAIRITREAENKAIRRALILGMGDKFSDDSINIFQNHFPIMNAYDIKKSTSNISYKVKLEYKENNKVKEKVMDFKATPKKEKGESPDSFTDRKENILNKIEDTLKFFIQK